jgi:hypothetical protein
MSLCAFVGEIVDIFSILPARHALIVMPTRISGAHAMRIADEEGPYLTSDAEVNDVPCSLMTHISNASPKFLADFIPGPLQFLPTARVRLAAALLFGKLSQLFTALSFERANAAPGHNQGLPRTGGHGSQVNLTQVDGCLLLTRNFFDLWRFDASLVSSKPLFQMSVQAPASSGRAMGSTREARPLPIGKTTCLFSRLTACAGQ